ncbi:heterokaryon incompatibility protein-domain-containing protein [Poronia punctata]|nr:heterokaryon incompatibility protein-domain-containing protein [Poronia punctata]
MWLINTQTYKLEAIINPEPKSYAILSHTWGDGEISFAQYRKFYRAAKKNGLAWVLRRVRKRDGLHKILKTVEMARSRGLQYAWVDTCCIDKSSSDELSEAINSMFKWYANASVCFAYLSDLPTKEQIRKELSVPASDADSDAANPDWHRDLDSPINKRWCQYFRRCRWFTRGWTLQELIAPRVLEFYDCQWNTAGSKLALRELIHDITHITLRVLEDGTRLSSTPVAVRMSWAADRDTTRAEDMAYCLVGIFDLNMPFLYGEGDKAFIRLQEEICKQSADLTLFAWVSQARYPQSPREQYRGMFAKHVSEFKYCNSIYHGISFLHALRHPYLPPFPAKAKTTA